MRYLTLGTTGLKVSELAFGAARFGEIDDRTADHLVGVAIDAGISTFDSADVYNEGRGEQQLGKVIAPHRDRIVLCTKVGMRVGDTEVDFANPNPDAAERWSRGIAPTDQGLSRKHIMSAVDASLRRLGTDYIDLYQVHRFDADTPLEETISALDDLVHAGKVRYVGCSGFAAGQLAAALDESERAGRMRFASTQATYSVVVRDAERELLPLCFDRGVGVLAFGVVSGGILTGRYNQSEEPAPETRLGSRKVFQRMYWTDDNFALVERMREAASATGRTPGQLAAGWVSAQPAVTAVLMGFSRPEQVTEMAEVFERPLESDEVELVQKISRSPQPG